MCRQSLRLGSSGLVALCLALAGTMATPALGGDEDFQPLVKGTDAEQFELVGITAETMKISADGQITVSGKPNGYFATKHDYHNFVLKFEWMYERPPGLESDAKFDGNSGLLVHLEPPHKVWPKCIEVQLANNDAGNIFAINGSKFKGKKDRDKQKEAIKPVGQWNAEEVTCQNGSVVCKINGVEVAHGTGANPDHGFIGWQSEGKPIHFRAMMIKTME